MRRWKNVPVHVDSQEPNYLENPVSNMRMILSRRGLLQRKGAAGLIGKITGGRLSDSVHVPMENTDPGVLAGSDAAETR